MTQAPSPMPQEPGQVAPHRGTLVLILGIVGIVIACLPVGPFAWWMGAKDLKRIKAGEIDPEGKGLTMAGMICGIIGTVFFGLSLLYWIFIVVLGVGLAAASATGAAGAP